MVSIVDLSLHLEFLELGKRMKSKHLLVFF